MGALMYYIFFINNIELERRVWTAEEIMNSLLDDSKWAFSIIAPNLKYMDKGDRVVVYLAGRGNRFFAANFIIDSKPYEVKPDTNEQDWLAMFPIRIDIRDIKLWTEKLYISDVIAQLDFIKDKKNYGLYFRQSTKVIEEKDFLKIIGGQKSLAFIVER